MRKNSKKLYGRLAQVVLDRLLENQEVTLAQRIESRSLRKLRQLMCKQDDALVLYEIDGQQLVVPLSHELPLILKSFPNYSRNLGRIAKLLYEEDPEMTCIDIGANVGDSIALIRGQVPVPILGIEADEYYFSLLERNTKLMSGIELEHALVVDKDNAVTGTIVRTGGTGRFVPGTDHLSPKETTQHGAARDLQSILESHPRFLHPRLLKLDTDGYDCNILMNAEIVLRESHPVVFFEYDPGLFNEVNPGGREIFSFLEQLGYTSAVFYDNTGPYAFTANLSDTQLLEDAYAMSLSPAGAGYFDIAVFHATDRNFCDALRAYELSHIT